MTATPRFSVTIPAFNAAATLLETVRSVQAQTFPDFEIVICDDGSTDDTRRLAEEMAASDERIRVITQTNRGSGGAYNTAVRNARADLIVMLSADDLLLPEHLASFDEFVRANPEAAVFSANGYYEYEDGTRQLSAINDPWASQGECRLQDLLHACFFNIGAVYRKEVFDAVGGFPEDYFAEDYVFFLHALAKGYRHRYLDKPLSVHRRSSSQKSADVIRVRRADIRALREVLDTESLTAEERRTARRVIIRHRINIAVRTVLSAILGPQRSADFISRLQGRRPTTSAS